MIGSERYFFSIRREHGFQADVVILLKIEKHTYFSKGKPEKPTPIKIGHISFIRLAQVEKFWRTS
jgi:hypothetical protein